MEPTREIYWNIDGVWIMYALFAVTMAVFAHGAYWQYRMVAQGKKAGRFDQAILRWEGVWAQTLGQFRTLRERFSGPMHAMFFWGFIVLFLGTVVVFLEADLGLRIMHGDFYLYFQSLALDVLGLLAIVGVGMALYKRFVRRPDRLINPPVHRYLLDDGIILGLFLVILVTGFVVEGLRIVGTDDPWAAWSPVGNALAGLFRAMGVTGMGLTGSHGFLWWFHLGVAFVFIAYIPFSKLRHLATSPLNVYFRSLRPMGEVAPIDIETAETLGAPKHSGPHLEAAAGHHLLHGVRPLPGRLPGLQLRPAPLPQGGHPGPAQQHVRRPGQAGPHRRGQRGAAELRARPQPEARPPRWRR